jgi:hypothetical protein
MLSHYNFYFQRFISRSCSVLLFLLGIAVSDTGILNAQEVREYAPIFQVDLSLPVVTFINNAPEGSSFGISGGYRMPLFRIAVQGLVTRHNLRSIAEARYYGNCDFLAGIGKLFSNKIDFSLLSGYGMAFGSGGEGTEKEESYMIASIPVKTSINFLIGRHYAIGASAYAGFNPEHTLYAILLSLGYWL